MGPNRIEFFGFPGCGKTTSIAFLQNQWPEFKLQTANIAFSLRNLWLLTNFLFGNPKILIVITYLRFVPIKYYKIYLYTIIRFFSRFMVVKRNLKSGDKYIIDEGVLQITWSLLLLPSVLSDSFYAEKRLQYIAKHLWPKIDLLVYHISLEDAEYIKRIKSRERQHYFSVAYLANNLLYVEKGKELERIILEVASTTYLIREV